MTDLRTAAQRALEALEQIAVLAEYGTTGPGKCHSRALNAQQATALRLSVSDLSRAQITALKAALAEPVQEPVAHSVIAGALFDIMGWLTSRRERIVLSSADNASPAVEAITEFAKMRGLSLDDAKVQDWNTSLRAALAEPRPIQECYRDCPTNPQTCPNPCNFEGRPKPVQEPEGDALTAAYMLGRYDGKRKPLTDAEIADLWHQTAGFHHHFARAIERAHGIGGGNE